MADPDRLTPAQRRALTRIRCEGFLRSGMGVSSATVHCLERAGLVRVTWSRRSTTVRHSKRGWETKTVCEWTAEPVIDDYQVIVWSGGREMRLTVFAALGETDAIGKAEKRYREFSGVPRDQPVMVLGVRPLSQIPAFLM